MRCQAARQTPFCQMNRSLPIAPLLSAARSHVSAARATNHIETTKLPREMPNKSPTRT